MTKQESPAFTRGSIKLAGEVCRGTGQIRRYVTGTISNPLLRNGHLLTLSSGVTGLIGLLYWAVTARSYDPDSVGRNSAALSMMMLLAAIAQLDVSTAMVRFVPSAGAHTRRLVAVGYLTCGSLAVLVSLSFVALAPRVSPGVTYFDHPLAPASFMVATVAYTLFVVQDGVLTGLRRAAWVPVENVLFGVAKVGLVLAFATALPEHGIFVSWLLPLIATVVLVTVLLFGWAIPRHQRTAPGANTLPRASDIARFVMTGYVGAVCSIASMTLMPILVITFLGAAANAGFAIAWVMAYSLHLLNINMGASFVVETASDQAVLHRNCLQMLSHVGRLLVPAVLLVVVLAPYVLGVIGPAYSEATGTLRLLSLGALPHLLVVVAVNSARVQRRMGLVVLIQAAECVLVLGLGALLLPVMGLSGAGLGWLLTHCLIAGFLLLRRDLWLTVDGAAGSRGEPTGAALPRIALPLVIWTLRAAGALGQRERLGRIITCVRARRGRPGPDPHALLPSLLPQLPSIPGTPPPTTWTHLIPVGTVTDLCVARLGPPGQRPVAVLKLARTGRATRELHAQRLVLSALSSRVALAGWRALLPRVLLHRNDEVSTVTVETMLEGSELARCLTAPDRGDAALTEALRSVHQFHRLTGRLDLVNSDHLRNWVDAPLGQLRESCQVLTPALLPAIERLGSRLRDGLAGHRTLVSWTHGDFTPGNVLISDHNGRVSGIVDWGGARPGQPSLLDSYMLLVCAVGQREGREMGATVTRLLRAGGLPERERAVLAGARRRTRGESEVDDLRVDVDERTLILLAWLHHAVELRRKCDRYRENPVWWALNAEPVLHAVADVPAKVGST
ncbi:hypothetical protein GCM10023320_03020 [Pseudonocardia adelaidensis]|uniref:Aminoglycoside phosphotransferase domain-containing protein n=1 Tax=Pseudonocardia adelaidensis TaxID=648754 RepID=A0ABP9N786_9PSEU